MIQVVCRLAQTVCVCPEGHSFQIRTNIVQAALELVEVYFLALDQTESCECPNT